MEAEEKENFCTERSAIDHISSLTQMMKKNEHETKSYTYCMWT